MDEALETALRQHPSLLLIRPTETPGSSPSSSATSDGGEASTSDAAEAKVVVEIAATDDAGSTEVEELVSRCLHFLGVLMRNCVSKHVFSSSEVCAMCICIRQRGGIVETEGLVLTL